MKINWPEQEKKRKKFLSVRSEKPVFSLLFRFFVHGLLFYSITVFCIRASTRSERNSSQSRCCFWKWSCRRISSVPFIVITLFVCALLMCVVYRKVFVVAIFIKNESALRERVYSVYILALIFIAVLKLLRTAKEGRKKRERDRHTHRFRCRRTHTQVKEKEEKNPFSKHCNALAWPPSCRHYYACVCVCACVYEVAKKERKKDTHTHNYVLFFRRHKTTTTTNARARVCVCVCAYI